MQKPEEPDSAKSRQFHAFWKIFKIGAAVLLVVGIILAAAFLIVIRRGAKLSREIEFICIGREMGKAAQQYFQTTGQTVVKVTYDPKTGEMSGDLSPSVRKVWIGLTIGDLPIEKDNAKAFFLSHPTILDGKPIYFSDEGKTTFDPYNN